MPIGARRVVINNAAVIAANSGGNEGPGGVGSPIGLLLTLTQAS